MSKCKGRPHTYDTASRGQMARGHLSRGQMARGHHSRGIPAIALPHVFGGILTAYAVHRRLG